MSLGVCGSLMSAEVRAEIGWGSVQWAALGAPNHPESQSAALGAPNQLIVQTLVESQMVALGAPETGHAMA